MSAATDRMTTTQPRATWHRVTHVTRPSSKPVLYVRIVGNVAIYMTEAEYLADVAALGDAMPF